MIRRGGAHRDIRLEHEHWTGVLYPDGLPTEQRLEHYSRQFCTVELNASYYQWPADGSFTSCAGVFPSISSSVSKRRAR